MTEIKSMPKLSRLYAIEMECFALQTRWKRDDFLRAMFESETWTAEEGGQIAGFLVAHTVHGSGYISAVDVAKKHRGKGIAAKLFKSAESHFRKCGCRKMRLHVEANNPAQRLYFSLGYRVVKFNRGYYGKGRDALSMAKNLMGK